MKVRELITGRVGRYVSVGLLGLTLVTGLAVEPASAQYQNSRPSWDQRNYRNWRVQRTDIVRIAQSNGYSEGFESGLADRANRAGVSYQSRSEYRDATLGYREEWGQEELYQSEFRRSYGQGYQDAYNGRTRNRNMDRSQIVRRYGQYGYDPYYGYPGYRSAPDTIGAQGVAERGAQQGYGDGYTRGQYDRSVGVRKPNPQGHGAFQHGLNGWNPQWGGSGTFQTYYRQYFLQGYEAGFYGRTRNTSGFTIRLR